MNSYLDVWYHAMAGVSRHDDENDREFTSEKQYWLFVRKSSYYSSCENQQQRVESP